MFIKNTVNKISYNNDGYVILDTNLEHNKDFFLEPNVLFLIGLSYEKINNFENANLYYQIGLELEPKHININKQLAEYYITENQINYAKQRVEAIKGCECIEYNDLKEKILKIKK